MPRTKNTCVFPECGRPNHAYGYCAAHNKQKKMGLELRPVRGSRPQPQDGLLWCGRCKQYVDEVRFGRDKQRDQPSRTCDPCRALDMKAYNARNAQRIRRNVTLKMWGLTNEQYEGLFDKQDHKCAICGSERRDWRALAIDHNHDTGAFRGLLCQDCNLGMGQFADDPDLLQRAVDYLRCGGPLAGSGLKVPQGGPVEKRSRERDEKRARRRAEQAAEPPLT